MSGLHPPAGLTSARHLADGLIADWEIRSGAPGGWIGLRLHHGIAADRTHPGAPAKVTVRTGPSTFGPDLDDPAEIRRLGWTLLAGLHALADVLDPPPAERQRRPRPADTHPTLFDDTGAIAP